MKNIEKILLLIGVVAMVSCSKPKANSPAQNNPFPLKYDNKLFSVNLPKGWTYDDSNWEGLDRIKNEVDFYNPSGGIVSFHFVKTFYPFQWESIEEVAEMAKAARLLSGDDVELMHETDSAEVGGYPASILFFANYVDNDTIIQKQYVTYLADSHIVIYFNEYFNIQDQEKAEKLGDRIISTIKLKKIENPFEDPTILQQTIKELEENTDEDVLRRAQDIIDQIPQE